MQKLVFKQQTLKRFLSFIEEWDLKVLFCDFEESLFDNTYTYIVSLRGSNGMTQEEKTKALAENFSVYFKS